MTSTDAPPARPKKARHRRSSATPSQILAVAGVCVVMGSAAALGATATPTGSPLADAAWRAALVTMTALAGSRARRWSLAVGAGLVTLGAGEWWGLAGLAALGITFALAWEDRRHRVSGAVAGSLIGIAALHLGWPTTTYVTALVAAAAIVPIWVSGYRTSSRMVRRRVRIGLLTLAAVVAVGVAARAVPGGGAYPGPQSWQQSGSEPTGLPIPGASQPNQYPQHSGYGHSQPSNPQAPQQTDWTNPGGYSHRP